MSGMSKEEFFKLWDDLHAGIKPETIVAAWDVDTDVMDFINSPDYINGSADDKIKFDEVIEGLK